MARFRRHLLICLLLVLPLQWGWAAAASLCLHESGAGARHFGHHEHRHQKSASQDGGGSAEAEQAKNGLAGTDGDCANCHGQNLNAVVVQAAVPALLHSEAQASPYRQGLSQRDPEPALRPPLAKHLA